MRFLHSRTTAIILAAGVLVGGANIAVYAANGKPLLLGRINKETKPAVLKNTGPGPALKIKTRASAPPLSVSSSKKVTNLNADKLDGFDSKSLQSNAIVVTDTDTTTVRGPFLQWSLAAIPAGKYAVSWDVNFVPLADADDVVCAVTLNDFARQFAADRDSGAGAWIATWLSGATVMDFNPATMRFFCQSSAANLRLKQPLTVAFQKVDNVATPSLPPLRQVGRATGRGAHN